MSAIRLIVCDIDGTLLNPDHRLDDKVALYIRRYVERGGLFTLATGRPLMSTQRILEQLQIRLPVILCNGAVLARDGETIMRSGLPMKPIHGLLEAAHAAGHNVLLFRGDKVQVMRRTKEIDQYERKEGIRCSVVPSMMGAESPWLEEELDKIILIGDMEVSRRIWARWERVAGAYAGVFQSETNYLELVPKHVSKGKALQQLSTMINIDTANTMAIGNQMNDLSMLRAAGIGAAVANSPDMLKAEADYVCRASHGEGVIEAIEQFIYGGITYGD
ncbi:Cof-type HAD-IIB family hydrolase [Paenibacillus sp. UMB4589-SE434]|uniref:Cof-type HAD-IIB family hydrolase n=1 Tax=Paenibacillus sp. UMB4589-SE434 TaxID=3046314 RepID=UPI00254FD549|nr:Cof-type HAD-IIB family hydrolase [Paenibacillus sp. UMB4589-SE434]MDK8181445.1 Cof-type HAD-IIB family hydrolase [Paenibacillus sp. UMB4589-SE434]